MESVIIIGKLVLLDWEIVSNNVMDGYNFYHHTEVFGRDIFDRKYISPYPPTPVTITRATTGNSKSNTVTYYIVDFLGDLQYLSLIYRGFCREPFDFPSLTQAQNYVDSFLIKMSKISSFI